MRHRTTILVQSEGLCEQLLPRKTPVIIGTAEDADLKLTRGSRARKRHATALQWRSGRWVLSDDQGTAGIYREGQRLTLVELTEPETVRLGSPSGPQVSLTPLPRPAPRWRMWLLVVGVVLLVAVLVLVGGLYLAPERTAGRQPFSIGACVETKVPWSAGQDDVRPPGQRVSCDDRFDYKVLRVIPVPTPQLTAFSTDKGRSRRALKLAEGRCPPASWPALGVPDASKITHEIYCVQDSVYTIDEEVVAEQRDFMCVLRDGEEPRLATSCSLRHDFTVKEVVPLAETAFPGRKEMDRIGDDSCLQAPGTFAFVATEKIWEQGYRSRLLCLETDNFAYADVIDWAVGDLRRYWDRQLPNASPKPSTVTVPPEADYNPKSPPRCYEEPLEDNAWYCPEQDDVEWDPQWLKSNFYDTYGDIAVAIVLAHEWGHVIQNRLGLDDPERWEKLSAEDQRKEQADQEHQADCYAGVWLSHYFHDDVAAIGFAPDPTDRNKAVHAIVDLADPWTTSDEQVEEGAHGDALKRMQDLLLGYERGQEACQQLVPL
jgi:hypothetical protein